MNFRIGILDDESTKATLVLTKLKIGFIGGDYQRRYSGVSFEPVEFNVDTNINITVENIMQENVDGIIIDYNLSSQKTAAYTGVDVAQKIYEIKEMLPVFVLTSYEEDLYQRELFSAFQVFDYNRYLEEENESDELHNKIIQQINFVAKQIKEWESEIVELLPQRGKNADVDSRIIELDSKIEKATLTDKALPRITKCDFSSSKINELIDKIDQLLGEK